MGALPIPVSAPPNTNLTSLIADVFFIQLFFVFYLNYSTCSHIVRIAFRQSIKLLGPTSRQQCWNQDNLFWILFVNEFWPERILLKVPRIISTEKKKNGNTSNWETSEETIVKLSNRKNKNEKNWMKFISNASSRMYNASHSHACAHPPTQKRPIVIGFLIL